MGDVYRPCSWGRLCWALPGAALTTSVLPCLQTNDILSLRAASTGCRNIVDFALDHDTWWILDAQRSEDCDVAVLRESQEHVLLKLHALRGFRPCRNPSNEPTEELASWKAASRNSLLRRVARAATCVFIGPSVMHDWIPGAAERLTPGTTASTTCGWFAAHAYGDQTHPESTSGGGTFDDATTTELRLLHMRRERQMVPADAYAGGGKIDVAAALVLSVGAAVFHAGIPITRVVAELSQGWRSVARAGSHAILYAREEGARDDDPSRGVVVDSIPLRQRGGRDTSCLGLGRLVVVGPGLRPTSLSGATSLAFVGPHPWLVHVNDAALAFPAATWIAVIGNPHCVGMRDTESRGARSPYGLQGLRHAHLAFLEWWDWTKAEANHDDARFASETASPPMLRTLRLCGLDFTAPRTRILSACSRELCVDRCFSAPRPLGLVQLCPPSRYAADGASMVLGSNCFTLIDPVFIRDCLIRGEDAMVVASCFGRRAEEVLLAVGESLGAHSPSPCAGWCHGRDPLGPSPISRQPETTAAAGKCAPCRLRALRLRPLMPAAVVPRLPLHAFHGKTHLVSLDLSWCTAVRTLPPDTIAGCPNLRSLRLPSNLEVIEDSIFQVTLKNLEDLSFEGMRRLTYVGAYFAFGAARLTAVPVDGDVRVEWYLDDGAACTLDPHRLSASAHVTDGGVSWSAGGGGAAAAVGKRAVRFSFTAFHRAGCRQQLGAPPARHELPEKDKKNCLVS